MVGLSLKVRKQVTAAVDKWAKVTFGEKAPNNKYSIKEKPFPHFKLMDLFVREFRTLGMKEFQYAKQLFKKEYLNWQAYFDASKDEDFKSKEVEEWEKDHNKKRGGNR